MNKNYIVKRDEPVYLVIGVKLFSGSTTYPEDFKIVGIVASRAEATEIAKRLNIDLITEAGIEFNADDFLSDLGPSDLVPWLEDTLRDEGRMCYDVIEIPHVGLPLDVMREMKSAALR